LYTWHNAGILKYQLDPFTNHVQDLYTDYFRDYKIARRSPLPRKATVKPQELLTEISGTATDSVTNEPVVGATVMVPELELVTTTDEDGFYLFDEVPVGAFTISCHAAGYKLPADVMLTVTGTESLQLNFELEAEGVTENEKVA
jgi:enamine deaminase RidA (YjgF/YER057c/UK114 family)